MGVRNLRWLNNYDLNSGGIQPITPPGGGSVRPSSPNINAGTTTTAGSGGGMSSGMGY